MSKRPGVYAVPCAVPPCRNTTTDPSGYCHAHAQVSRSGGVPGGRVPSSVPKSHVSIVSASFDYDVDTERLRTGLANAIAERPSIVKILHRNLRPKVVGTIRTNPDSLPRVLGVLSREAASLDEDDLGHLRKIGVFPEN